MRNGDEAQDSATYSSFAQIQQKVEVEDSLNVSVSRPKSWSEHIAKTHGRFIIQLRSGLSDCRVPILYACRKEREIFIDWRDLFRLFSHVGKT